VSSRLVYAGSKRAARKILAAEREVARVNRDLNSILQLAPHIRDDAQFRQILADVEDDAERAAVEKLLTPFLFFAPSQPC